jgi:hypothetical protein
MFIDDKQKLPKGALLLSNVTWGGLRLLKRLLTLKVLANGS